jgi:antiviral helicase SKI2
LNIAYLFIQRLDEVCKDIRKAARVIGDTFLYEKMEQTSAAIRRDIVFAASLYTTEDVQ